MADQQGMFPADETRPADPSAPVGGPSFFPDVEDPLRQSFEQAQRTTPDLASRVYQLRLKTGLPAPVIERNLDAVERQVTRDGFNADAFRRENPALADWLAADPQHVAIAHDDLGPLSLIGRTLQVAGNSARATTAGLYSLITVPAWDGLQLLSESLGLRSVAQYATSVRKAAEANVAAIRPQASDDYERAFYSGWESLGSNAPAAIAGYLTAGAAPAAQAITLGILGGQVGLQEFGHARDEGQGTASSILYGLNQGGIEVLTELIPAHLLLGDLAKNAGLTKLLLHQVASEVPGEQVATVLQDLNEWAVLHPDRPFSAYLAERPSAAAETLIATVTMVGAQSAALHTLARLAGAPALQELHTATGESQTRTRAIDAFNSFVERASQDGLTHVEVPAIPFTEYFQEKGENAAQLALELTGDPEAYRLAMATGGDLSIPTTTYLDRVVGSGHEPFFAKEVRLGPNAMNARELEAEVQAEAQASDTAGTTEAAAPTARRQVFDAMVAKLEALNRYTPEDVRTMAGVWAAAFDTLARREAHGRTATELLQQYPVHVVGEGGVPVVVPTPPAAGATVVPPSVAQPGETPEQRATRRAGHEAALVAAVVRDAQAVDPTVDPAVVQRELEFRLAMREEAEQARRDAGQDPRELLLAIADAGGLGPESAGGLTGELKWLKEGNRFGAAQGIPGVFRTERTVNDRGQVVSGLPFDVMVQRLQQDPRFTWIEDANALIEAIDDALRNPLATDAFPGTEDLAALGVTPGSAWWREAWAPAADDTTSDAIPPEEGGDTSFEFSQASPSEPGRPIEDELQQTIPLPERVAVVAVRSDRALASLNPREMRGRAFEYVATQASRPTTNDHTGWSINVSSNGLKKSANYAVRPEQLLALRHLDALVQQALYLRHEGDRKHPASGLVYEYLYAPFTDGRVWYVAKIGVRSDPRSTRPRTFYTLHAQRVAGRPAEINADYTSTGAAMPLGPSESSISTADLLALVNEARQTTAFFQGDDTTPPGWRAIEAGGQAANVPPGKLSKGTYNPVTATIRILARADRSTFLHESAHHFLEVLSQLAAAPDAAPSLRADMRTLLAWFKFDGDLAAWRALSHEARRDHHEQFARAFEQYLGEGRAPTPELQPLFARFRAWLRGLYGAMLRALPGHGQISDDVRKVMDRLLATDDAIAAAEADAHVAPLFLDAATAGVSDTEFNGYRARVAAASQQAQARLQAKLLADLRREDERWWQDQRATVRAEVEAEIAAQPVYRALAGMRGQLEGAPATPLNRAAVVAQFGSDLLAKLPKPWVYSQNSGLPPDTVAALYGFESGEALIQAITTAPPFETLVDERTDDRMLERHGDLLHDPTRLETAAREAVAGEHRDEVIRAELRMLQRLRNQAEPSVRAARADSRDRARAGAERIRTEVPDDLTLKRVAEQQIASMRLANIRPERFFAAARRGSRLATEAAARQDFDRAVEGKQQELVNLALYRAALAAREAVDSARERFSAMFAADGPLAKRRTMDYVHAARAIAAGYFFPDRAKRLTDARDALEVIRRHDTDLFEMLDEQIRAARAAGSDLESLTYEAFQVVASTVDALWEQSLRTRQVLVRGELVDRDTVTMFLEARLTELGTPATQEPRTKMQMYLLGARAALRRVEHWVDYLDGGDPQGVFRKYIWEPIADATDQYRVAKAAYIQRYLDIVRTVEQDLVPGTIAAPELDYTFQSRAELLHALLHTGNESNFTKLLRGRQWGRVAQDGTLDRSQWDAFLTRMHRDGRITARDWTFVQAVWDLLEESKAEAQRAHREMYGHYFSEITARPVETPFGTYRGGYVPAIVDPLLAADAAVREERANLTGNDNAGMFPTTGRGFTKARVESYAKPLQLDLRLVPGHLDKVLRFIHLEPRVKDVGRYLWDWDFKGRLAAYDPTAASDLLIPWLQRTAQQRVSKSSQGWSGRAADAFFRTLRTRTGLNMMAANVINTLQQFTGLSTSLLKVEPRHLKNALWRYVQGPQTMTEAVNAASAFMRTRTTASAFEIQKTIDDLLLAPTRYEQLRAFASKHGYFMQSGTQNVVDLITWAGAHEQAIERGAEPADAVREGDSAVRETQGSFAPEDLAAVDAQVPFIRAFVMFYGFFNMLANVNGNELAKVARDMGLRRGAGRALYVYTFGFMVPTILSEVLRQAIAGWDDDDDETHVDEFMWLFFGSQGRALASMVPLGQVAQAALNVYNSNPYDDRISTSPALTLLESAVRVPKSVYEAITDEEKSKKRAVKDLLSALGLLTGLPFGALSRPAGYVADVVQGKEQPETALELARGLVSGRGATPRQ